MRQITNKTDTETNVIEPTQVWTAEEWEKLDYRNMPVSPLRTLLKTDMFMRMYSGYASPRRTQ